MAPQRYISPDLTHFVGRSLTTQRKRYLLLKRILRTRLLKASSGIPGSPGGRYEVLTDPDLPLSENEACVAPAVCFCDIPVDDLPIHMEKYGRFGIAFSKRSLAYQGATPVNYVPLYVRPALVPYEPHPRGRVSSQQAAWNDGWNIFERVRSSLPELDKLTAKHVEQLITFLEINVFANAKFFDHRLQDDHKRNYYMEREWRVYWNVTFRLGDVERVILPRQFGREFRRDFPRFSGEIIFVDARH